MNQSSEDKITFNVKALAQIKNMTIAELAKHTGISVNRLKNISAKRTELTLSDAKKLSDFTNVPIEQIDS